MRGANERDATHRDATHRNVTSHDASVAWFKLAEFVSRGEKEKALNLYRLLSHSFDEKAYALQLEADVLWAFEDMEALERYRQAAFLYKKEQKIASAVAIYEHLLTLQPGSCENLVSLLEFYARLSWVDKFKDRLSLLVELFENRKLSQWVLWEAIETVVFILREQKNKKIFDLLSGLLEERIPVLLEKTILLYNGREEPAKKLSLVREIGEER